MKTALSQLATQTRLVVRSLNAGREGEGGLALGLCFLCNWHDIPMGRKEELSSGRASNYANAIHEHAQQGKGKETKTEKRPFENSKVEGNNTARKRVT